MYERQDEAGYNRLEMGVLQALSYYLKYYYHIIWNMSPCSLSLYITHNDLSRI